MFCPKEKEAKPDVMYFFQRTKKISECYLFCSLLRHRTTIKRQWNMDWVQTVKFQPCSPHVASQGISPIDLEWMAKQVKIWFYKIPPAGLAVVKNSFSIQYRTKFYKSSNTALQKHWATRYELHQSEKFKIRRMWHGAKIQFCKSRRFCKLTNFGIR